MTTSVRAKKLNTTQIGQINEEQLLDTRLCDLEIKLASTPVANHIETVKSELRARGIRFRPHFWVSDEWFSPSGVPGVAVPFFLLHPRLTRIERKFLSQAEGSDRDTCLKILRHETGHTIDTAYRLSSRQSWQKVFGNPKKPYPTSYLPKPFSQKYVSHLDPWYAQSHPEEDFAETFAVWLKPGSRWKTRYKNHGALKKLEYIDNLMSKISKQSPKVSSRKQIDPLSTIKRTLREYYRAQRKRYGLGEESYYEQELHRLFSSDPNQITEPPASTFLRKHRRELRTTVAHWTGVHPYTIDMVIDEMISRCRELKLKSTGDQRELLKQTFVMLAVQMTHHLHTGRYRITL